MFQTLVNLICAAVFGVKEETLFIEEFTALCLDIVCILQVFRGFL